MQISKPISLGMSIAVLAACSTLRQPDAPNDSTSRMLNEMKAYARPAPTGTDPREVRITSLEKQVSELEAEVARLRKAAGDLTEANRRVADLERQLAERDQAIAALRSQAGDSARLASQLSEASNEKDRLASELAALRANAGEKERLAADLAAAQARLATLQAGAGEKDKLAEELAAAKRRITELEGELAAMRSTAGDSARQAAEMAAARQRIAELERQLAERDKELTALRGDLSAEMAKLKEAQRGLIRALRPQIDNGNIMVDLNNERLLINLASSYLFAAGEDQLKPAGAEALKQVGAILKDFPEYKVAVDGHTDNRPIRGELKKKFPTNKELSEARAVNAAKALGEGGLGSILTHGYADSKPVSPNTTEAGRAKNRRVEVVVTK